MGLTLKKVVKREKFDNIYKELRDLLSKASEGEGVELREVCKHYHIPTNRREEFKQGLKSWHLKLVRSASDGKGSGPYMIIYSKPQKAQKTQQEQPSKA